MWATVSADRCGFPVDRVGRGRRRAGRRTTGLAELDADRPEPAPDVAVDGWGPERDVLVELPFGRVEDERLGLRPAEPAVRADELLERGDLPELGYLLTEQQQVRRMGHRVLAPQAHDRVWPEQSRRILTLDLVSVEEPRPVGAEHDRAELPRAHHQHRDAGVRGDRRDETRVKFLELLDRQPMVVPGEIDKPEIP